MGNILPWVSYDVTRVGTWMNCVCFRLHTSHVLTAMIACFVLIAEHKMVADESVGLGFSVM